MRPPVPRCYELLIRQASEKLNIPCVPSRLSILTRPLKGRQQSHYCGQCNRRCVTHSNCSSPSVLNPPAMAIGRLRIVTDAMAREVTFGENGLASGVVYIDKKGGCPHRVISWDHRRARRHEVTDMVDVRRARPRCSSAGCGDDS